MEGLFNQDIPDDILESLAQMLLPEIQKYYEIDDNMNIKQQNQNDNKSEHD